MTDSRIQILFLIPSFIVGGAEMQLLTLVRGLDKTRFHPQVVTLYPHGALRPQFEASAGVQVTCMDKKSPLDFCFLKRLVQHVRRNHFDIIQMYNTSAKAIGLMMTGPGRIPISIVTERSAAELPTSFGSRIYRKIEKRLIRRATVLIANSQAGAQFLRTKGVDDEKVRVIYNGLDLDRLYLSRSDAIVRAELGIQAHQPVVGTVGSLKGEKDHDTFLLAAQKVLQERPECKFILVGDGPRMSALQELARTLGISGSVIFTGSRTDVASFVKIMNVFVLTSPKTEGCSNAILEAMALARPVLATQVGGNAELVEDSRTGFLIQPGDKQKLAQKITMLIRARGLAEQMGRFGREKIQAHFTLEQMIDQYQNLYLEYFERK